MRFQEGEGRPGNTWGTREAGAPNTAIIGAPPKKPPEGFPEGSNTASVEPWSLPLPQQLAVTSRRGIWCIGGLVGVPLWRPRSSEEAGVRGVYVFVFAAACCLESFRWKNTSLFALPRITLRGVYILFFGRQRLFIVRGGPLGASWGPRRALLGPL